MSSEPMVIIQQGALRGQCEKTGQGHKFFSFLGIPYAQPPLGELRFKAPQAPKPWKGIREAAKEGSPCYNKDMFFDVITGTEDCLYLNVFTSKLPNVNETASLRPVMVWLHGGAFVCGSGRRDFYGPEFLIDKDIVLVSLNCRLGALGFLYLKDPSFGVHGNASLKDQNMALKWVQANIKNFGGDPNNVTLFGESSGAAAVCFHMVSPMSKGLFHKAIMQSGVASCIWAEGSTDNAYTLVKELGKEAKNDAEAFKILQAATKEEIISAQWSVKEVWKPSQKRNFCPIVETHNNTEELFLPDTPLNLIKSGRYNKVPVIIGFNSGEGLILKVVELRSNINLTPKSDVDFVPYNYNLEKDSEKMRQIGAKIREYYYGEQEPLYALKQIFYDYISDAYFVRAILDVAEKVMKTSDKPVFLYRFCMKTRLNLFAMLTGVKGKGTCHSEELFYLFKSHLTPEITKDSIEDIGIQRMTEWWTNFAKYSDPNGLERNDELLSVKWPTATANEMEYMDIDKEILIKSELESQMIDFWKSIEALVEA